MNTNTLICKHGRIKLKIIEWKIFICMSLKTPGDRIIMTSFVINKTSGLFAELFCHAALS